MKSNLTAMRERLGGKMTKAELARRVDVDRSHITKLEQGRVQPSAKLLLKLAKTLRCDATELFDLDASRREAEGRDQSQGERHGEGPE